LSGKFNELLAKEKFIENNFAFVTLDVQGVQEIKRKIKEKCR